MYKIAFIAASLAFALCPLHAASDAKDKDKAAEAKPAQTSRMKTCSTDAKAKGLKGDERKAFMSECLKKKA
jgi:hypothetical protein